MNFYKTLGLKNSRIDVADALRGLAVAGIILFHPVEHFNMWDGSITHPYALAYDDEVADVMALLLSGKMYGIFALLFGLSFFIMNDNQQQKGRCFSGRFAWRMFLLALLGIVNTAFFDGDILFSYAIYGLLLIPLSYLPSKYLWGVVAFLFVQPIEIYSLLTGWQVDMSAMGDVYGKMAEAHHHGTFWENAWANLQYGQVATYYWCMVKGRHTQTICLFVLGMLVGRNRWLYNENNNLQLWKKVLLVSIVVLIIGGVCDVCHLPTYGLWLSPIYNFFILSFIVSAFVLLWYGKEWFRTGLSFLRQFGKMSLTNYFLQSIIGCGLFCYYGFNLQAKLGITYAVLVGIAMVVVQCVFSNLWLKYHSHGPFEGVWKKLTWINRKG